LGDLLGLLKPSFLIKRPFSSRSLF